MATSILNVIVDVGILALPLPSLWKMVRGCGESWGSGGEKECGMLNEELGLKEGRKEGRVEEMGVRL